MEFLSKLATRFIGLFQEGGNVFVSLVTGIVPLLICLLVAMNALIKLVGEDKIEKLAQKSAKHPLLRYMVLPVVGTFFFINPMTLSLGKFLPEKYKPAYMDSAISFCHPITGLFPHANPAELFVWLGIAQGVTALGLPTAELAVRYFIAGVIAIFIRGLLTEKITLYMLKKNNSKLLQD